jgi:hypothetical protein
LKKKCNFDEPYLLSMKKFIFISLILIAKFSFGQTIAIQSFEAAGDTWIPITLSTPPCTNGGDRWDYSATLSSINPSNGSQFWGIQDLNGNCGGTGFETITLPNIDVSSCTNVVFSFDYNVIGYDNGDDIQYELFFDNISQGITIVVNGNSNFSTGGWVTETVNIPSTVTNVSVVIYVKQNGGSDYAGIDNVVLQGNCVACGGPVTEPTNEANSLTSSNVSCTMADVNWNTGADATNSLVVISTSPLTGIPTDGVAYAANSVYGTGDILNGGEYVVYNGSGSSVSISGLTDGTTYFITIFEYNGNVSNCEENYLTGGISMSFTTITGCTYNNPYIQSILYNSCNGSNEGTDEIVYFTTGTDPLSIDDITIYYPSQTYCNTCSGVSGTIDGGNLNNPTYINNLNSMAGCTVFAYADPIPANSEVMIFTGNPPSTVLDYSSQCGSPNLPVYVIFNDNNSTLGRFSNTQIRSLTIDFGNGTSQTVTYDGSQQAGDGATVLFDQNGNDTYISSNNCVYPLLIELGEFYLNKADNNNTIYWTTLSETNCDYFEVQKSTDGINFSTIGKVIGYGNSTHESRYSFTDYELTEGTTYYRLKQFDFDAKYNYSYLISTNNNSTSIFYSNEYIYLNLTNAKSNQTYQVNIYNLSGQLINTSYTNATSTINWSNKGFFIIEIPELEIKQKIASF